MIKRNKYGIFDWCQLGNDDLLDNFVQNPESQITGSAFSVQGMCFSVIPCSSTIQIITYLIHIVVIMWVNQLKMVIQSCLSS